MLALLGSSITFMAANWEKIFKIYRANLVYLNVLPGYEFTGIISNSGNSPVFVSHLVVYWRGGNTSFPILKTIKPNEISAIEIKEKGFEGWPLSSFIASTDGKVSDSLLASTRNNISPDEGCFVTLFYSEHAHDLARMNSHYALFGHRLVTDSAQVQIHYNTAEDSELVESFRALAVFVKRRKPECEQIFPQYGAFRLGE
jgi:hypothetical protein